MKKELQEQLVEKYPEMFEYLKVTKGPITPIMFGFECHDGWFTIIDTLFRCITNNQRWNVMNEKVSITQVKEKFGGLRVYYIGGDETIEGMVNLAEALSYRTCEFCGTTQNIGRTKHWVFTVCKECYDAGKTNQGIWRSLEEIDNENKEHELEMKKLKDGESN